MDEFERFEKITSDRQMQDMKSVSVDIRERILNLNCNEESEGLQGRQIDFSEVEFQIDLLKTDEINLYYIPALILEKFKEYQHVAGLKADIRHVIMSSLETTQRKS